MRPDRSAMGSVKLVPKFSAPNSAKISISPDGQVCYQILVPKFSAPPSSRLGRGINRSGGWDIPGLDRSAMRDQRRGGFVRQITRAAVVEPGVVTTIGISDTPP